MTTVDDVDDGTTVDDVDDGTTVDDVSSQQQLAAVPSSHNTSQVAPLQTVVDNVNISTLTSSITATSEGRIHRAVTLSYEPKDDKVIIIMHWCSCVHLIISL